MTADGRKQPEAEQFGLHRVGVRCWQVSGYARTLTGELQVVRRINCCIGAMRGAAAGVFCPMALTSTNQWAI